MNDNARKNANNWPVSLNNEAIPYDAGFNGTTTALTATAVSTIIPYARIPPSIQKQYTKPFSPVNMKKMANKYTSNTTPAPDAITATPVDASSQSSGLKVSNSPYSLINRNFPSRSISTKNLKKEKKEKW